MSPDVVDLEALALERPRLSWGPIDADERRQLDQLERRMAFDGTTLALLLLDPTEMGRKRADTIEALQARARDELSRPHPEDPVRICACVCGPVDGPAWSLEQLEAVLCLDLDRFVRSLDARRQLVVRARWAIDGDLLASRDRGPLGRLDRGALGGARATQLQLAAQLGTTESRVCQIQKQLSRELQRCLSVAPRVAARTLEPHRQRVLARGLSLLRGRFVEERRFLHFLELAAGLEKGELVREQYVHVERGGLAVLDRIAAVHPSPIPIAQCVEILARDHALTRLQTTRCIERWVRDGCASVAREGLYPLRLSTSAAIAHVLSDKPAGMAWPDVLRAVNARGLVAKPLDPSVKNEAFRRSPWVYLAGTTLVCHRHFLELSEEQQSQIFCEVRRVLSKFRARRGTVKAVCDEASLPTGCDAHVLRELARRHGEEHGVFFDGGSRRDTLSLDAQFDRMNTPEVVLSIFDRANGPLSVREATARTRRRNEANTSVAIRHLALEGKLIRIDSRLYDTRERALAALDVERIRDEITRVVLMDRRPLEADLLRESLNEKLGLKLSKWLYASLALEVARERGWFASGELVGVEDLPFRSPRDAFRSIAAPEADIPRMREQLAAVLRVSGRTLQKTLPQWRSQEGMRRKKKASA